MKSKRGEEEVQPDGSRDRSKAIGRVIVKSLIRAHALIHVQVAIFRGSGILYGTQNSVNSLEPGNGFLTITMRLLRRTVLNVNNAR